MVAVEIRGSGSGRARMRTVEEASTATLTGLVREVVEAGAVVQTDGCNSYKRLSRFGYDHRPHTQRPGRVAADDLDDILPRVHNVISNLKTWLQDTRRGVSKDHLQVYLDEYVFRFNRRRSPMAAFQSLLGRGGQQPPTTYRQIYTEGSGGRIPVLDPSTA